MGQFALDLARFAEKAGDSADQLVREVIIDVFDKVKGKSPVDTGRFKNNWNLSVGKIDYSTTEEVDPSGREAQARAEAIIASFKVGPTVFITNNLPYANRLEDGYSQQAPVGMVKITVVEFKTIVKEKLAKL